MEDDRAPLLAIATALGHPFTEIELLRDALTHRSFAHERPQLAPADNERLEFLGDSVLGVVISTLLWERFPEAPEGELTRRRADIVCEAGLARIARELGLGNALRVGRGEELSKGREKPRLLASALEACFGAAYLDGGFEAALTVARRVFGPRLDLASPGAGDHKSRIQEFVQARGWGTPRYELCRATGPDHDRTFVVAVVLDGQELGQGEGRSKTEAEQAAAANALERMEVASEAG